MPSNRILLFFILVLFPLKGKGVHDRNDWARTGLAFLFYFTSNALSRDIM